VKFKNVDGVAGGFVPERKLRVVGWELRAEISRPCVIREQSSCGWVTETVLFLCWHRAGTEVRFGA